MRRSNLIWGIVLVAVLFLSLGVVLVQVPLEELTGYAEEHRFLGALIICALMFISTVIAPLTTIGLLPLVSPILGPFTTALASIVGWVLGAVVAFLIARYGGRPFLARYMDVDALSRYEAMLPPHAHSMLLIMLRMAIPVDVLSYALGLMSTVSLAKYTVTTTIGVLWFAFAFSYLGSSIVEGNYVLFAIIGVASVLIFGLAIWYVGKYSGKNKDRA